MSMPHMSMPHMSMPHMSMLHVCMPHMSMPHMCMPHMCMPIDLELRSEGGVHHTGAPVALTTADAEQMGLEPRKKVVSSLSFVCEMALNVALSQCCRCRLRVMQCPLGVTLSLQPFWSHPFGVPLSLQH